MNLGPPPHSTTLAAKAITLAVPSFILGSSVGTLGSGDHVVVIC